MDGLHSRLNAGLDAALGRLRERASAWATLAPSDKVVVLRACRDRVARCADRWSRIASEIKDIATMQASGEEMLSGPWGTMRALDAHIRTLCRAEDGRPSLPYRRARARNDRCLALRVFPNTVFDRFLLPGVSAEVWLDPDAAIEHKNCSRSDVRGSVVAVMGAGNVTSIAILDVISKLVNDGAVCMLKVHPLLEPLLPVVNDIFAPLIERGFAATTCGDAAQGAYLCGHPVVDAVHVTGSTATYHAIARETTKTLTAELGNVTPVIVIGGRWSKREIAYVAEWLVSAKLHNNGYDCVALQVLVLPSQWSQHAELVAAVEAVMRRVPPRSSYYPGSAARFSELTRGRPSLRTCGLMDEIHIPPAIVDVNARDPDEALFTQEAFSPLLAVAKLDGDPAQYLRDAVRFCNERLTGNLAAHIVADPAALREYKADIDSAVEQLRYGCVGVNLWCGVGFLLPELPWGAAPGNTSQHIGSGVGVVHNAFKLSGTQKSVLRGPFCPFGGYVRQPWFVTHRKARAVAETLCSYQRRASPFTLARLAWLAISG